MVKFPRRCRTPWRGCSSSRRADRRTGHRVGDDPTPMKSVHVQWDNAILREKAKPMRYAGAHACEECHGEIYGKKKAGTIAISPARRATAPQRRTPRTPTRPSRRFPRRAPSASSATPTIRRAEGFPPDQSAGP